MIDLLNSLSRALPLLGEMSLTAAYVAAVVAVLRLILKKRAPKQVLCLLWLVVFARLLIRRTWRVRCPSFRTKNRFKRSRTYPPC